MSCTQRHVGEGLSLAGKDCGLFSRPRIYYFITSVFSLKSPSCRALLLLTDSGAGPQSVLVAAHSGCAVALCDALTCLAKCHESADLSEKSGPQQRRKSLFCTVVNMSALWQNQVDLL